MRTLFAAALDDLEPERLSAAVIGAYQTLDREAGLGTGGPAAAPEADRAGFDPQQLYLDAADAEASFGGGFLGGLLSPLRELSFWTMKKRARICGETGGHRLVSAIRAAGGDAVRIHLMGHSFGCIVVSSMLRGTEVAHPLRVSSAFLVQGALSLWSFAAELPGGAATPGWFRPVLDRNRISGPMVVTTSRFDRAVGSLYPVAAGAAGQVAYDLSSAQLPTYGALGAFGARGSGVNAQPRALTLGDLTSDHGLAPGQVYNVNGDAVIRGGWRALRRAQRHRAPRGRAPVLECRCSPRLEHGGKSSRQRQQEASMSFTQGHALLIGVGTYQHEPRLNVPITAADAEAVGAVLRDPAFCGYPEAQVKVLRDAAASRGGILAALDALAARAGEGDTVLLFFCGHGDFGDDGDYYLTTHDTRLKGGKVISGSGLRQGELIEKLRAVKAKRLLLLVNACHSGELAPTLGPGEASFTGAPLPSNTAAALLATGEGRIIITACREDQLSYIGNGDLTLFTDTLVNGLRGQGTSSTRGYISAFDLYTHLYFTIEEAVREQYGAAQEPELTVLKGVGPFAVSLFRGATTLGEIDGAAPPPEDTAVREVSPKQAQARLTQIIGASYQANLTGNGAIAQGPGAQAVGAGGVLIGGKNTGNINTGTQIDTGGGAYVRGHVTAGGDFVGRDRIVHGDQITTGDVSGTGIAVGRGAHASVVQGMAPRDLEPLFAPLLAAIAAAAPDDSKAAALQQAQALKAEVAKGKEAEDGVIANMIEGLAGLVPEAVKTIMVTFGSPILAGLTGPITKYVLGKLKGLG